MKDLPESMLATMRAARRDPAPRLDLARLLQALRDVTPVAWSWRLEFERVFASRVALSGCAAAAVCLLGLAGWQAWVFWQDVWPWAQLIAVDAVGGGGAS